jgi:hypothetical protein
VSEWIHTQGSIFRSENDIYSLPPPLKIIFFPPLATRHFLLPSWPFALILPYFAFILPFFFPFSPFLSPFFFFFPLSSFFSYIFPLLLFPFLYFFPQMTSVDIPPPQRGKGIFQYIDPCSTFSSICCDR